MEQEVVVRGAVADADASRLVAGDVTAVAGMELVVKLAADVRPSSRAEGEAEAAALDEDDVVESTDAEGWTDFVRVGDLRARTGGAAERGAGAAPMDLVEALTLDPGAEPTAGARLDRSLGERRVTSIAAYAVQLPDAVSTDLASLESLISEGIDLATQPAARLAAAPIVRWLETPTPDDETGPRTAGAARVPGVYGLDRTLRLRPDQRIEGEESLPSDRSLVLVHGTFSCTEGGFGGLGDTEEWDRLVRHYDGSVFALEHPTLSVGPVSNALALARSLPRNATVDLVTHSRGGLVADLLSMAAAGTLDPSSYVRPDTDAEFLASERAELQELAELAAERALRIGSLVRVAAPSRGTVLASGRLDQTAKLLFNVIPKASGPLGWTIAVIKSFVLAFLDQRTDPRIIPGIEAMMPTSPLVRLVNSAPQVDDRLGVIAGDVDRSTWFRWFIEKAGDLFFGGDHDYVVDTSSMTQGVRRARAGVSLQAGADVNHFTYFTRDESRRRLADWLTQDDDSLLPPGFDPLTPDEPLGDPGTREHRGEAADATVVVVPDLFASILADQDGVVWPNPSRLVAQGLELLDPDLHPDVIATALHAPEYGRLLDRLAEDFDVVGAPYDHRRPVAAAAAALADRIRDIPGTVHLVGHGVGGLVVRAALAHDATPHDRIGRIVLLGTPLAGSVGLAELAAGRGELVTLLGLTQPMADASAIGRAIRRVRPVVEAMPAIADLEALPGWEDEHSSWDDVAADDVGSALVGDWGGSLPVAIVGVGHATASAGDGDGMVGVASATAGIRHAYVAPRRHGDLVTDPTVVAACVDIIRQGSTNRLRSGVPAGTGAQDLVDAGQPDDAQLLYPTAADFVRVAVGRSRRAPEPEPPRVTVRITHGDLRFARHPVMVGHYAGSPLAGSERALDLAMDGRLSARDLLGVYPGRIEECAVVPGPAGGNPEIGIVVGLGEQGMLSGARVAASVSEACVRLAMARLDEAATEHRLDESLGPMRLGISSVLLGVAGSRDVSIHASVGAIVEGVFAANERLAGRPDRAVARFDEIEVIEVYEDVATEALRALERIADTVTPSRTTRLLAEDRLHPAEGGLRGQPPPDYQDGQWTTIIVEGAPSNGRGGGPGAATDDQARGAGSRSELVFTSTSMAARAEKVVHASQVQLVEQLTASAIRDHRPDPQLGNTLYELLLPNYLKSQAAAADNLQLVLDREATHFPWEMLAPRGLDGRPRPLATGRGVIRRLLGPRRGGRQGDPRGLSTAGGHRALVIGDPPAGDRFVRLAGARREAAQVAGRLAASGYDVTQRISEPEDTAQLDVLNALFANDYRVLHVAAHGVLGKGGRGIVIGDGLLLTAAEIGQLAAIPPLVFLNCCHLGAFDRGSFPAVDFAATVAEQLIDDGVRAVIAAGWAVDDGAAMTFADVFYTEMLGGEHFGAAILAARRATADRHPHVNTWGAYQCYGDPGFRLREAAGRTHRAMSSTEVERQLEALAVDAVPPADVASVVQRLIESVPGSTRNGQVLVAAARACASHGDLAAAIEHTRAALSLNDGRVSIKAIEQLGNLEGRYAQELAGRLADQPDETGAAELRSRITDLLERAGTRLTLLLALGETTERHRLLAAHERRFAAIAVDDPELGLDLHEHLVRAREHFDDARRHDPSVVDPDTTINHGVFVALVDVVERGAVTEEHRDELLQRLSLARQEARRRRGTDPSFWDRVADPDADLLAGLLRGDLADHVDAVAGAYVDELSVQWNALHARSVIGHVGLLERVLATTDATALTAACGAIRRRIEEATPRSA